MISEKINKTDILLSRLTKEKEKKNIIIDKWHIIENLTEVLKLQECYIKIYQYIWQIRCNRQIPKKINLSWHIHKIQNTNKTTLTQG